MADGMSEDRLPGWNIGAVFLASLLTGAAAALTAYALIMLDNPIYFQQSLGVEFVLGLGTIALIGLAVGLIVVMPVAMIFSAIGIRLALCRPWVAYRRTWAGTGAAVGAIVLLIPFLIPTNDDPFYGPIAMFGAACGTTAALLCHRLLGIRQSM